MDTGITSKQFRTAVTRRCGCLEFCW